MLSASMVARGRSMHQIRGMELNLTTLVVAILVMAIGSAAASARSAPKVAAGLKMIAATGYVGLALAGGASDTGYGRAMLAALCLCWVGDLLLIAPGRGPAFLGGLGTFLAGHLAFAWAFQIRGTELAWVSMGGIVALVVGLGVLRWLAAHDVPERMKAPVGLYVGAITAMVAMSVGTYGVDGTWIIPAGAVAFMASDIFVARERFVVSSPVNVSLGLPLYFLAQVLLALSV